MDKRRNIAGTAFVLAVAAATLWVVFRGRDWGEVWAALGRARAGWLAFGAALAGCFIALEALGTYLTLGTLGRPTPMAHCLGFSAAGFYFSSITPSATGGQPAQVFYMARRGVPAALGTLDMLLLTVSYQAAAVLLALAAWLFRPGAVPALGVGLGVLLLWSGSVNLLLTVGAAAFLFRPKAARRMGLWVIRLGERLHLLRDPARTREKLEAHLAEYRRGSELLGRRWWLFVLVMGVTVGQLLCQYLIPWTVYRALGLSGAGALQIAATQALVSLAVGALPIPGAVGASEAAFLAAYRNTFGTPLAPAAMVLCRGLSFYLPLAVTGASTALLHLRTRPKSS